MRLLYGIFSGLLYISFAQASSSPPTLNLNDAKQLQKATSQAIKNLMTYYTPNKDGVFDQIQTPWFESGMIWAMHYDYAKWTGDHQYLGLVTAALVNTSHTTAHDFFGGKGSKLNDTLIGHWNDDGLWQALAVMGGADIFGPHAEMPGAKADWISLSTKTFDQVGAQIDNKCGGGIYWYRDRKSHRGAYKALITNLQFAALGARNYIYTKNSTAFTQAKQVLDWVTASGVGNPKTGVLFDGVGVEDCSQFTIDQWSYLYGQLYGALAWMHKATGEQKYLALAVPFLEHGIKIFAGTKTAGVIAELCEASNSCNRDQQGFKSIFARNLAYLYRQTNDGKMKALIQKTIDTSVSAMVRRSCDEVWNCNGNWTQGSHPSKYVRSQHVSAALLVAALGIHHNPAGGL